ncbi:MAG: hypothetical protein WBP29_12320 [Candidatus Zixiibacteriota bacterium]
MRDRRTITKCHFADVCYLSESLQCYGYQVDCALYRPNAGSSATEADFHKAVNTLIEAAKSHQTVK